MERLDALHAEMDRVLALYNPRAPAGSIRAAASREDAGKAKPKLTQRQQRVRRELRAGQAKSGTAAARNGGTPARRWINNGKRESYVPYTAGFVIPAGYHFGKLPKAQNTPIRKSTPRPEPQSAPNFAQVRNVAAPDYQFKDGPLPEVGSRLVKRTDLPRATKRPPWC